MQWIIKPAQQVTEIPCVTSAARFTGWQQLSPCIPSADALGYMPSPTSSAFHLSLRKVSS
jgi:hypothetical protein